MTAIIISGLVTIAASIIGSCVVLNVAGHNLSEVLSFKSLGAFNRFDNHIAELIVKILNVFGSIWSYAYYVLVIAAFLAIIIYSFKLLLGTIEIKKVFAESIYKIVIVTIVFTIYPTLVSKVYNAATYMGLVGTGGAASIKTEFINIAKKANSILNASTQAFGYLQATSRSQAYSSNNSNGSGRAVSVASEHVLDAFIEAGLTKDEARDWAESRGIHIMDTGTEAAWSGKSTRVGKTGINTFMTYEVDLPADDPAYRDSQYQAEKKAYEAIKNTADFSTLAQQIAEIRTLSEVLTGYDAMGLDNLSTEEQYYAPTLTNLISHGEEVLNRIFSNLFIDDSYTLSAGGMFYVALITSKMFEAGAFSHLNENSSSQDSDTPNTSWLNLLESNDKTLLTRFIGNFIIGKLYKYGIIICVIFVMCEYYLTIIEYLLVCSLSCLLIPLFFIDATKQYAVNILKSLLSYFFKILVTAFMCTFVLTFYITCAGDLCSSIDITSMSSVLYFLFVFAMGFALAKNSGKIAGAVISGNPTMGLGDLAREFSSMGRAASRAAHQLEHAVQTGARNGVKNGQELNETKAAAGDAKALARQKANDTFDDMRKNTPGFTMSEAEQKKAVKDIARDTGRDFWKQALQNKGYKMLHGHGAAGAEIGEDGKFHAKGFAMPGTQYWDEGEQRFVDVNSQNAKYYNKGSDAAKKAEEIAKMYTSTPTDGTGTKSNHEIDFPDEALWE